MDIYSILKEGLRGEGSDKMWCITQIISDAIEDYMPKKQREILLNNIYYSMNGGHFDKDTAQDAIEKFYYQDNNGNKHYGPYWPEDEVRSLYNGIKNSIPEYNFYDFEVTMNMIKSDNYNKLKKWFPNLSESELLYKYVDESLNYLEDEDNPYGNEKIWKYLNGD